MKLRTLFGAALLAFSAGVAATPQIGQPAPAFTGVDTAGNTHALSDFLGKIVVLEWTNHDCPYVRKHYNAGNMQAQQRAAAVRVDDFAEIIDSRLVEGALDAVIHVGLGRAVDHGHGEGGDDQDLGVTFTAASTYPWLAVKGIEVLTQVHGHLFTLPIRHLPASGTLQMRNRFIKRRNPC